MHRWLVPIFIWDELNVLHIAEHGVDPDEAEYVVETAKPPYPRKIGDGKYQVWATTEDGRYLQVVYTRPAVEDVDMMRLSLEDRIELMEGTGTPVKVIHTRDLTPREKRRLRRT